MAAPARHGCGVADWWVPLHLCASRQLQVLVRVPCINSVHAPAQPVVSALFCGFVCIASGGMCIHTLGWCPCEQLCVSHSRLLSRHFPEKEASACFSRGRSIASCCAHSRWQSEACCLAGLFAALAVMCRTPRHFPNRSAGATAGAGMLPECSMAETCVCVLCSCVLCSCGLTKWMHLLVSMLPVCWEQVPQISSRSVKCRGVAITRQGQ